MTAWLILSATAILLGLIFWRRQSPDFRRRSEYPKFQFLVNLGLGPHPPSGPEPAEDNPDLTSKGNHENHEP